MISPDLNTITDAVGWPDAITVRQTYDYTSPDGNSTITGTATFTYTRASLADYIARPTLLFNDLSYFTLAADTRINKGEFLPVQSAVAKMPGWLVWFGAQDAIAGAFTGTTHDPAHPDADPVVTPIDANCDLTMTCTAVAPGRRVAGFVGDGYVIGADRGGWLGLNVGCSEFADNANYVGPVSYGVALLQPGIEATETTSAFGPVYRVTFPADAQFVDSSSITVNGTPQGFVGGYVGGMFQRIGGSVISLGSTTATCYPRSPFVLDVQLESPGDTLAAGSLSYVNGCSMDSVIDTSGVEIVLADPFSHTTVAAPRTDGGLTVTVQF